MEGFVLNAAVSTYDRSYLEVMRKSKTNFFFSSVFMEQVKSEGLRIIYAFCRMTDDIVDNAQNTAEEKRINLMKWEQKLRDSLYNGFKEPFFNLLKQCIEQFGIPHKPFFDLIKGMRTDLEKHEYGTFDELYEYCYCAASSVGLMSIEVFGRKSKESEKFAEYLGIALQLTNIIRDFKKDFDSGRIYIPSEDLKRFGYSIEDLKNNNYNDSFRNLMKFECERAREYYTLAGKYLTAEDKKCMTPALIMEKIYFLMLKKIEKRNYYIFGDPVRISSLRKFTTAVTVFIKHKIF